jgi:hypothetical protein
VNYQKWNGEKVRVFLRSNNIRYEASGCGSGIHVEVYANDSEAQSINCFLDTL